MSAQTIGMAWLSTNVPGNRGRGEGRIWRSEVRGWSRLALVLAMLLGSSAAPASAQSGAAILAAAEWRVGVERLAKLQFERLLPNEGERIQSELLRERSRIEAALGVLRSDNGLTARRRSQLMRASDGMGPLLSLMDKQSQQVNERDLLECYQTSEALAAQLGFFNTGLSNEFADSNTASMIDMLARAATMALRLGKLNFAAARNAQPSAAAISDARQTLVEFRSALDAISTLAQRDSKLQGELDLVRHQWIIFGAALNADGLVKDPSRLPHIGSTTDRIAQALLAVARRVLQGSIAAKTAHSTGHN